LAPKATEFGKLTQHIVLARSKSFKVATLSTNVPVESPYATPYYWIIAAYILSRVVSKIVLLVKFSLSTRYFSSPHSFE